MEGLLMENKNIKIKKALKNFRIGLTRVLFLGCVFAFLAIVAVVAVKFIIAEVRNMHLSNTITYYSNEREKFEYWVNEGYDPYYQNLANADDSTVANLLEERSSLATADDFIVSYVFSNPWWIDVPMTLMCVAYLVFLCFAIYNFFIWKTFSKFFRAFFMTLSSILYLSSYAFLKLGNLFKSKRKTEAKSKTKNKTKSKKPKKITHNNNVLYFSCIN
jgi:hypothetical protein